MISMDSLARLCLATLVVLYLSACQQFSSTATPAGYPQQALISFDPGFDRPDLETHVSPASAEEVTTWFGSDVASLPRLGILLVLVTNKDRAQPIAVSHDSVQLTLADGRVLKPLQSTEIKAWLKDVYGSDVADKNRKLDHLRVFDDENGALHVSRGAPQGMVVAFRFPTGAPSDGFEVKYVLDLGTEQLPVTQHPRLHINP